MPTKTNITIPCLAIALAMILWTIMFSPLTAPYVSMWTIMTLAALSLTAIATYSGRWYRGVIFRPSDIMLGITIAVSLWGVFWLGDKLSQLLFNFARPEVNDIYAFKNTISPGLLSILLLLIIGPAEEIFWRGYIQRTFANRWGTNTGFIAATAAYTLIHIGSCNFMLIMAAMVAGGIWGLIYRIQPQHLPALIISHALWDTAVFVWFPL